MDRILRRLIGPIVLGAVVFVALAAWSNFQAVQAALRSLRWGVLPLVLALSFTNYLIRFLRWEYYLDRLGIERAKGDSLIIFLSGLVMSVSPGKLGEVFKSVLLRQRYGTPIARSAPIVLAERLTDLLALVILGAAGAVAFGTGGKLVLATFGLIVLLLGAVASPRLVHAIVRLLGRLPWVGKPLGRASGGLLGAYDSTARLLGPVPLAIGNLYAVLGWFCECVGFYLVLDALGTPVQLGFASFAYALATIAGALSMLPGGIGLTEGSLAVLLTGRGVPEGAAVAATFVIRLATLWFAVLVGAAVLLRYRSRFVALPAGQAPQSGKME
jgi:glycosyltransferase 2 family protein